MFRSQQLIFLFSGILMEALLASGKQCKTLCKRVNNIVTTHMGKPLDMPPLTKNPTETRILWKSNMHRRKVGASKSVKSSRARQRASAVRIQFYTLCYR